MWQVVEPYRETYFRHLFLRCSQKFTCRFKAIIGYKLGKCYALVSLEECTECRAVHSDVSGNIIKGDVMHIVSHNIGRNLLHTPYVALNFDGFTNKRMVFGSEYDR